MDNFTSFHTDHNRLRNPILADRFQSLFLSLDQRRLDSLRPVMSQFLSVALADAGLGWQVGALSAALRLRSAEVYADVHCADRCAEVRGPA
jgi:hypothetical protein